MARNQHIFDFMNHWKHTALTFDDVSLITRYADFLPDEAELATRLTSRTALNIPFVSAAMDTVTEGRMAIAMAMLGGIGVIHKNLSPAGQAAMIREVKHHLNGLIDEPVTFRSRDTVADIRRVQREKKFKFSGFPILDDNDELVGMITATDMKFAADDTVPVSEIMSRNVVSAPPRTTLQQAYEIMIREKIGKLPLVEGRRLVGLYSYADVSTLIRNVRPLYNRDDQYRLRVAAAVGPADYERVERLADEQTDVVVIDTAHGHSRGVIDMTRWLRKHYERIDIVAGNIATGEAACALRDAGAHAVKVGIGPGSICTTRVVTGVGVPQVTAIHDCARALDDSIPVVADGGIRNSGDVVKALVAGAESVMMGSILAGTEESPGEKIISKGRQYVLYRGMGSLDAIKTRPGSRERYGLQRAGDDELVPQGIEGMVPFAGSVEKVMTQYCGGLRSGMGYCGARSVQTLRERGRFVRVTHAGVLEAHPHDVAITKEAPNYRS